MVYGFGGRIDNDSNAVTMIDEENRTAETKGYVNGEYVEFAGGSSTLFTNVTLDDSTGKGTLDKTFGEIKQAVSDGNQVICKVNPGGIDLFLYVITLASVGNGGGMIIIMGTEGSTYSLSAESDSAYPSGTMA